VFCAAPAVRHVGKVEFPLLASVEHRNVTAPGVPGFPLCQGCLASGWAVPYASRHYGLLAVFDSSDEQIAAEFVVEAVDANLQMIELQATDPPARNRRGAEEVAAPARLTGSGRSAPQDFVTLVLFNNDNKTPKLSLRSMDGRRCDFVCTLGNWDAVRKGWDIATRLLTVTDRKGAVRQHGLTVLARALFDESDAMLLRRLTAAARQGVGSGEAAALDDLAIH
jgi:CRISPR-associated protein Cst1